MKKIFQFAALVATFASCAKTEKILINNDGTWNIDRYKKTTEAAGFTSFTVEELNFGIITFNETSTGTIEFNDGTSDSFDWNVSEDIITLDFNVAAFIIDFDVLTSDKDFQEWRGSYTEVDSGITYITILEFELSKI